MERVIELRVEQGGLRVDRYIADQAADLSRSFVQKLLDEGRVTISGQVPKASYRVEAGDVVVVRVPPPQPVRISAEEIPLSIVYEDADLVVVDKPAGMVVHPAHGHPSGTLVNALLAQRQFKKRLVHKAYLVLTEGSLPAPHGVIDAPIGRDPRQRKRMAVVAHGGREARTEYRVLERFSQHTLAEAQPVTGRTHQIRIHFASIGHPVAGDRVYGFRKQRLSLYRQFLHAARIGFRLPSSGEAVEFTADLPHDLALVLNELRQGTTGSLDRR
jgi:23S rRNA pseudouridine1911/1915/1917 synthase